MSNAVGSLLDWAGSYLNRYSDTVTVLATPGASGAKVCVHSVYGHVIFIALRRGVCRMLDIDVEYSWLSDCFHFGSISSFEK